MSITHWLRHNLTNRTIAYLSNYLLIGFLIVQLDWHGVRVDKRNNETKGPWQRLSARRTYERRSNSEGSKMFETICYIGNCLCMSALADLLRAPEIFSGMSNGMRLVLWVRIHSFAFIFKILSLTQKFWIHFLEFVVQRSEFSDNEITG